MPYIQPHKRDELEQEIENLSEIIMSKDEEEKAGLLNYAISRLLSYAYQLDVDPRYNKINSAVGVTECVKLELYRRLGGPYEDQAKFQNGDIEEYSIFNDRTNN